MGFGIMGDTCHKYPQKLRSDLCSEIQPVQENKKKGKGFSREVD